ncbi:IclR family transcriptional regulator [Lutispora sp.]|uniref:IclR family transcriptional regulator n=1 Tax=Lutispora sp. TaxID=2828727 RepID=UPI000EEF924F|nr:IclR family transcriptional regulator [Lutispora sp.]MEA4963857.1 IclR family transcriptional regulator [Lutispora sp.]HCJ56275.1 hypothetical protein [Clostridiaceae bacterium]
MKEDIIIQAVRNSLDILYHFTKGKRELSLEEISQNFSISKSTAYRMLQTLTYCGFLKQNEKTKDYSLDTKSLELGSTYLRQIDLRHVAEPILSSVSKQITETITLAVPKEKYAVFIDRFENPSQNVKLYCDIGKTLPYYCGAIPKAIFACFSDDNIQNYLNETELKPLTNKSIINKDQLLKDISMTRDLGYSFSDQEVDIGVSAVGAAIMDYTGNPVGGIAFADLSITFTEEKIKYLGNLVKETADKIGYKMGYLKKN